MTTTMIMMMMMTEGRIRKEGDVSEEEGVGLLMKKSDRNLKTNTCCCHHSVKGVTTYSHGEGFSVTQLTTPAPEPLLRGRVTIIMVIHPNLNLTCSKKHMHPA
jgi:hypothetical protein